MSLGRNIRSMPAAVWILFLGTFINRFGSFVMPFLLLYLTRQGVSEARAGIAVGAYGLGHLAAAGIGGHLADTLGRKKTIALSMFTSAGSMLALSQASSYIVIVILTLLAGITAELYRPASGALIADLVPPDLRVTAYALYRLAINLGFAAGPATAGFLAERSFLFLFIGDAATSVLFGTVALIALRDPLRASSNDGRAEGWAPALRGAVADARFVRFLFASILGAFVIFQFESTFALHVTGLGYSPAAFGTLLSLNGLLIVFCELPLAHAVQRFRTQRVIAAGYLFIGAGFAFNAFATSIPLLAVTVVIWTVGEMISAPTASAYVANLAPEHLRGRYIGLWGATWSIGLMTAPALGAPLFGEFREWFWISCGVLGCVAAALVIWKSAPQATAAAH